MTHSRIRETTDFMDLEQRRLAILKVVSLVVAAACALIMLMGLAFEDDWRKLIPMLLTTGVVIIVGVVAFGLLRQRRTSLATYGLPAVMAAAILLNGLFYDGLNSILVGTLLLLVLIFGLIARWREIIIFGGTLTVLYIGLLVLELTGNTPAPIEVNNAGLQVTLATLFVASMILAMMLTVIFSRTLAQAAQRNEDWANDMMQANEQLMEKNIQQIELGTALSGSAAELSAASQQQASGATEQASAVSEVSSTIEELGYTARQIAAAADQVRSAAQQTLESLASGQQSVDEAIEGMERIKGRVQEVSNRVLSLGERSQQISDIIALIDDVSDETHLLALNAAIEAAGAGEHGRRFAVVAAEVKSLANRTLAAAREVKGVIAEIQTATNASVLATEDSVKEVEAGVSLGHRAGQEMDAIVMLGERTAQLAQEISLATAQQQTASEQVVETMREIAEVSRQTASGSRQTAEAAATLTNIATRLHSMVHIDASDGHDRSKT